MALLTEVKLGALALDRFVPVVGSDRVEEAKRVARDLKGRIGARVIWNVNSTAVGGGVAEMLQPLLSYSRGLGVDTRWVVIQGSPDFFKTTKRLHHALHGSKGDGLPLSPSDREIYEQTTHANAVELCGGTRPGDVVILHDPQTAGMAPHLIRAGAVVIWRCHIGHDHATAEVEAGWAFLRPYLQEVPAFVFSRQAYAPADLDGSRLHIIAPSIDAFSAKNQELSKAAIRTLLVHTGLVEGPLPIDLDSSFDRSDGTPGRVHRRADIVRAGRPPAWDVPLVVQVSRWDPLKDMLGVMQGFAQLVAGGMSPRAELVLAGPNVHAVADDPEGPAVFDEVLHAWFRMPHTVRDRIHVAMLPTSDVDENAAIVNALQRHATVVVQKSLHEGFGLTVTEAMWKARPVIASRVGGIQDQIVHGESGILIDDPRDLGALTQALATLLEDPEYAKRMGTAAKARAREHFLGIRHLLQYATLINALDEANNAPK